jgi:hypothetical protein
METAECAGLRKSDLPERTLKEVPPPKQRSSDSRLMRQDVSSTFTLSTRQDPAMWQLNTARFDFLRFRLAIVIAGTASGSCRPSASLANHPGGVSGGAEGGTAGFVAASAVPNWKLLITASAWLR